MRVCYIFRNRRAGFSIAKVFNTFIPHIEDCLSLELPCHRAGISSVLKNILFLWRKRPQCDIYHLTGNVEYGALLLPRKKVILTIHDLVLINHNEYGELKRLFFYYLWFYLPLKRARVVTCISDKTRQDLLEFFPWAEKKTFVVPNPVSEDIKYLEKEFNKNCPVILHIGTRENKNLECVVEAIKGLDVQLRIIGGLSELQKLQLEKCKINYSAVENLTDQEVAKEYENCDVVSFPSTYEGFGLPIIEGFSAGRIVVTSSLEPMKSISNGYTILVDPYDVDSIRSGFVKAINNDKERSEKIEKGLLESMKYSPKSIASKYNDLYNQLL